MDASWEKILTDAEEILDWIRDIRQNYVEREPNIQLVEDLKAQTKEIQV